MFTDPNRIDTLGLSSRKKIPSMFSFHSPIATSFKIIGLGPISIFSFIDTNGRRKNKFTVNWISGWGLYSCIVIFLITSVWFLFLLDRVLFVPLPFELFENEGEGSDLQSSQNSTQGIMKVVHTILGMTFPLSVVGHAFSTFFHAPDFVRFMLLGFGLVVTLVSIVVIPLEGFEGLASPGVEAAGASYSPITFFMTLSPVAVVMFGNDFKSILMIRTSEEAFKQIKEIIQHRRYGLHLSLLDVRNWIQLTEIARKQVILNSKIQGINLLIDLVGLFTIWCGTAFGIINIMQQKGIASIFTSSSSGAVFLYVILIRLTSKTFLIERMCMQEQAIADEMRAIDVTSDDISILLEMKILIDVIATTPSKISIRNMFTFNNKLLITIMGQVASYLLVLLQFQTK